MTTGGYTDRLVPELHRAFLPIATLYVGKLIIDSISTLDRPVMVAYLMLVALLFITINLTVDIAYAALDPRLPPTGKVALAARLAVQPGTILIESLDLGAPLVSLKGSGAYAFATRTADAKASVHEDFPDAHEGKLLELSHIDQPFSRLA